MIPPICPSSSSTYTWKPNRRRSLCLASWSGRGFFPGALTSTNAILPPGRSANRSGIPSKPGDTNLTARPPAFLTAVRNFCSMIFSRIMHLRLRQSTQLFFVNLDIHRFSLHSALDWCRSCRSVHKLLYIGFSLEKSALKGVLYYDLHDLHLFTRCRHSQVQEPGR